MGSKSMAQVTTYKLNLLLWNTSMTNLSKTLWNRDITLSAKIHSVKAINFQIVTYVWL